MSRLRGSPHEPLTQLRKASARVIRLLGLDANMPVRSFTACCQTVTAACGEFVPRGEQ